MTALSGVTAISPMRSAATAARMSLLFMVAPDLLREAPDARAIGPSAGAEHVPAAFEAGDLDVRPLPRAPLLHVHPPADELARLSPWSQHFHSVLVVADGARHRGGRGIFAERARPGPDGAKMVEGEAEHGLAHLLADALALELARQPRTGRDAPQHGEVLCVDALRAQQLA